MKKLLGMKKNFSSFENKKLKNLDSVSGGMADSGSLPTNSYWYTPSTNEWNCADTDTYVDGKYTQRQACLTDACDTTTVVTNP